MKAFAVTVLLCATASAALAQPLEQRTQWFLADMPAVAHVDAGAWCLTEPRLGPAIRDPQCRVESFDTLGADGATRWYAAKYRRSAIATGVEPEDTLDLDEIVVFADSADTGRVRPVWHIRTERWTWFLTDVRAEGRTEGLLIELFICLNGTGGCAREYLLASDARLTIVEMPFVDALRARLPANRTLHKGVTLDLATLRGTWPVSAPGDGNCCPSFILDYEVRLEGTRMELVDATLRPIRPATPADHLSALLPALRESIPLGEWKASRPEDGITPYGPGLAESTYEDWCARGQTETQMDSTLTIRRTAYFYPPRVPDPPVLPVGTSAGRLVDTCRLGFAWIEVVHHDSAAASRLVQETRAAIARELGAADTTTRPFWAGAASWRQKAMWKTDGATVVSAFTSGRSWTREDLPQGATRLLVAATAVNTSGITLEWEQRLGQAAARRDPRDRRGALHERFEELVGLASPGAAPERALRSWIARLEQIGGERELTVDEEHSFADAIADWLTHTASAPAAQRAAALAAADVLMQIAEGSVLWLGNPDRPALRDRLSLHGAQFLFSPLGSTHVYTHTWLKEALRLDPAGRAGEIALLALMEMGFETSGMCMDQGGKGFRAVIARGEELLRTRYGSTITNDVRFLVAQAYSDIIVLANGGAYTGDENVASAAEVPAARNRAIALYTEAFGAAPDARRARESWPNAWRLMAGLTPTRTYFYCVYD